jgi:hypothetical protein
MSRSTRSVSTMVLMAALGCSSRQDATNNSVSTDASMDASAETGRDTNGEARDAGSSDVNVPFCELGAVEAGTAPAGDAEVPLNHRPTHACCPSQRSPGPSGQPYSGSVNACSSDSQCTAGVNGRCFPWEGLVSAGGCSYDECFTDSTCGSGTPCVCRASLTDDSANVCDPGGNCVVDADCGPGGYCSPSTRSCYVNPGPYYCHTPMDTCINDSDCPSVEASSCPVFTSCAYDSDAGHWGCSNSVCCPP